MKTYLNNVLWTCFILLSIFCIASNPFANAVLGDSAVFAYVGQRILDGGIPYRDVFEHKGPMIFYINALGLLVPWKYIGLWIIECTFFFAGLFCLVNFSRKTLRVDNPLLIALICEVLISFASYGNHTEIYAYPVILFLLTSVFSLQVQSKRISGWTAFGYGISFMFLFLLRANLVVVAFVIAVFYLNEVLRTKDWVYVCFISSLTFLGMLVLLVPFVIYFYAHGALYDAIYMSIIFNLQYVSHGLHGKLTMFGMILIGVIVLNMLLLYYNRRDKLGKPLLYNLLYLILVFISLLPTESYPHYYIMVIPGFVLPIGLFMSIEFRGRQLILASFTSVLFAILLRTWFMANFEAREYVDHVKNGGSIFKVLDFKEGSKYKELVSIATYAKNKKSVLIAGYPYYYMVCGVSSPFVYCFFLNDSRLVFAESARKALDYLSIGGDEYVIIDKERTPIDVINASHRSYVVLKESPNFILMIRKDLIGE